MTSTPPLHPTQSIFERVLARQVAAPDNQHGRLVHVLWNASDPGGRLVQLYVNGELAHVCASTIDREAWLLIDGRYHQQIELLAVDPRDAATPSPQSLAGLDPATTPRLSARLLRDASLPIDAQLVVSVDNQLVTQTPFFASDTPRGGFGAVYGEGGFGYDASIGPGLGLGQLGFGPLGSDGEALTWQTDTLDGGEHTIRFDLLDKQGGRAALPLEEAFTIDRLPQPPSDVTLTPELILTWN